MRHRGWAVLAVVALAVGAADPAAARARALKGNPARFFGPDAYPPEAQRAGEEGRVVAELGVDAAGKVATCKVTQSSGSVSLDRATCEIALAKVTFSPATDRRGKPIASVYTLPVRWVLPTEAIEVGDGPFDHVVDMTVQIDAEGEVLACSVSSAPKQWSGVDYCAGLPVGGASGYAYTSNGTPVGGTIVRTWRERFTPTP